MSINIKILHLTIVLLLLLLNTNSYKKKIKRNYSNQKYNKKYAFLEKLGKTE